MVGVVGVGDGGGCHKLFVVAVVNSDEAVRPFPLLRANIVPCTLRIDLLLPPVDNTVGCLNVLII